MPIITKQNNKPTVKKTGSVVDRIAPLGSDESPGIKMVVYGQSGTGKTRLWSTFPKPILAILASGGKKPSELQSINSPELRKTVDRVAIHRTGEVKELVEYVASGEKKYATVVLDHATGLQDFVLKEILGLDELPAQGFWGMASQQQYGQCTQQAKEYFRALLDLDCHVVFVAHERESNTDSDSEVILPTVGAALTPSCAGWLNGACTYICQTFKRQKVEEKVVKIGNKEQKVQQRVGREVDYCLRTGPDAVYTTKFRVPRGQVLPDMIVDPTFEKIQKIIQGG